MSGVSRALLVRPRRFVAAIVTTVVVGLVASACAFTVDEAATGDSTAQPTATTKN